MNKASFVFTAFTAVILFFPNCSSSRQSVSETMQWMEYYGKSVNPDNRLIWAKPTQTLEQTPGGQFVLKNFYYDTKQPIGETFYTGKELQTRDGKHAEWSDEGMKTVEGQHKNNRREGMWRFFDRKTGKLSSVGAYKSDKAVGEWVSYEPRDSSKTVSFFVDGEKHGKSKVFTASGILKWEETWEHGKLISSTEPKKGENDVNDFVEVQPTFPCNPQFAADPKSCGEKSLMKYLSASIRYPKSARDLGITGRGLVTFVVNKDGSISDVEVIRGVCDAIKNEVVRVVEAMPTWTPGTQNGVPVRVRYTLPVMFRLE